MAHDFGIEQSYPTSLHCFRDADIEKLKQMAENEKQHIEQKIKDMEADQANSKKEIKRMKVRHCTNEEYLRLSIVGRHDAKQLLSLVVGGTGEFERRVRSDP